jgi:alpha-mannosidase
MTLDVHVVTHTHWDREWYHPVERFRQRLVELIDELIDDPPAEGESFLLDGQAIVIEDYLAVRPEREPELRRLLENGRLEAGPWFVLADELIPSGEALVRNLLAGRRVLSRFGAVAPRVLYCPDSFGHPAALPTIAAGFGLPLIILWRGFGGKRAPHGDTFRWASPAGEEVLVYHLPRDGYEFGSHLPGEAGAARERWARMRQELVPRSSTGVILVPNGADHHARQRQFRHALQLLEDAGDADGVHRSSLSAFSHRLVERAGTRKLPVVRGELRNSYSYTWTLQGTFATRAHEKRLNAVVERMLIRESEPWAAMAARSGRSRAPLIHAAWRTLLEAHPHDTLCGCSIDDVADAMELRLRSARNQAVGVRDDAILDLIGHDAVGARDARDRWAPIVVLRNPVPRPRGGVAVFEIEEFIADVGVGPGSAPSQAVPVSVDAKHVPTVQSLGPLQILGRRLAQSRTESPRHYPDNDLVQVTKVAAWIDQLSAYGIATRAIGGGASKHEPGLDRVVVEARAIRNAALEVLIGEDGTLSLRDLTGGRTIAPFITLLDEADVGDTYTPAPRPRDHHVDVRRVRRIHRGPLLGALAIDYRITSPGERSADVELQLTIELRAGERFVRLGLVGENRRENHRVRLRVHGDVHGGTVWADAAFGPMRRDPIVVPPEDQIAERVPPTAPLHRYVSSFNSSNGLTLASDGLAEYEPLVDGGFAVTLVRAVGELSRNDLPERPGHAGWPASTPGAQCLGPFEAAFAVLLHGPRLSETVQTIERAAEDFLLPISGATLRSALGGPSDVAGPELIGAGLAVSAVKQSEDGEWLVLRCVNVRDEPVTGMWRLPFEPGEARLARLDETAMQEVELKNNSLPVMAPPRGIVTHLVR